MRKFPCVFIFRFVQNSVIFVYYTLEKFLFIKNFICREFTRLNGISLSTLDIFLALHFQFFSSDGNRITSNICLNMEYWNSTLSGATIVVTEMLSMIVRCSSNVLPLRYERNCVKIDNLCFLVNFEVTLFCYTCKKRFW